MTALVVAPEIVSFAEALADAAGAILRARFRAPFTLSFKPGDSPVTEVDRAVESRLREMIADRFPAHGVVGEEYGAERADADEVWVIDPIDGTRLFMAGVPLFGVLIAYVRGGAPALGVIDQPITGERWLGGPGLATRFNGRAVRTRACADLSGALLCASSPHYFEGADADAFERLRRAVGWTQYGTDCYGFGLIASGLIDLGVETDLGPHDFMALAPVIAGAGGVMTDWEGRPLGLGSGGRVLAAGDRAAHERALAILAGRARAGAGNVVGRPSNH